MPDGDLKRYVTYNYRILWYNSGTPKFRGIDLP